MEFIDLKRQYQVHQEVLDEALLSVAASARYINGPQVARLEENLAGLAGVKEAVGVGSGTDALLLALMGLGLRPGDEVIVPAFTFFATAECVSLLGGVPVFADVEETGATLDPAAAEAAITSRTVGLIPVDLFGQCAQLEKLEALAQRHGLWLIEDAAQSLGARRNERMAGAFGQVAATSFFPAKPLGCMGEGGMLFTDDPSLAEAFRSLRDHGQGGRYEHVRLGINGRLDTIQAAVLLAKLSFFQEELLARDRVAAEYGRLLAGLPGVTTPVLLPGNTSIWAQYTLKADDRAGLIEALKAQGIPTAIHYPQPLHRQPVYRDLGRATRCPAAERLSERVVSLPMHPYLTAEDQARVARAVADHVSRRSAA